MDFKVYLEERLNVNMKVKMYKFLTFVFIVFSVFLLVVLVYASRNEKVVLVPLNLPGPVEIRGNDADPEYVKSFTYYIAYLFLNYDYSNIRDKYETLLNFIDEAKREDYRKVMLKEVDNVLVGKLRSKFEVETIKVDKNNKLVVFGGKIDIWSENNHIVKGEPRFYYFRYKISMGKFFVDEIRMCSKAECLEEVGRLSSK